MPEASPRVCPASRSWGLDNIFRSLLQPPEKIFGRFIHPGDTVLDIGCGPGFFTRAMARMVGENGQVIAVDLQEEMLEKLRARAGKEGLLMRIRTVNASEESLNLAGQDPAVFALAFYVVHEVPDKSRLFRELWDALVPGGELLVVEPTLHVTPEEFQASLNTAESGGFRVTGEPKVLLSRARLLEKVTGEGGNEPGQERRVRA
jgi:ubiquinone/menaquinone biosynthesis C-methylase UbiE